MGENVQALDTAAIEVTPKTEMSNTVSAQPPDFLYFPEKFRALVNLLNVNVAILEAGLQLLLNLRYILHIRQIVDDELLELAQLQKRSDSFFCDVLALGDFENF